MLAGKGISNVLRRGSCQDRKLAPLWFPLSVNVQQSLRRKKTHARREDITNRERSTAADLKYMKVILKVPYFNWSHIFYPALQW